MSNTIVECAQRTGGEVNILELLSAASLEFIGQAGLGHSFAKSGGDTLKGMKQLLYVPSSCYSTNL